jgi:hypothetical protein
MGLNVLCTQVEKLGFLLHLDRFLMKLLFKLLLAVVVLLTTAFAQEPTRAVVSPEAIARSAVSREQVIVTGSQQRSAPLVQPKALPPLNPSLGEIARRARAAHAAGPKAQVVIADDAPPQK